LVLAVEGVQSLLNTRYNTSATDLTNRFLSNTDVYTFKLKLGEIAVANPQLLAI